jgi:hypothetical protein
MKFLISVAEIETKDDYKTTVSDWVEDIYYGTLLDAKAYAKEYLCRDTFADYEIEIRRVYSSTLMPVVSRELV